jgi:hypothetical protein
MEEKMRYVNTLARAAFGMLLILHGFAHSPGVLGSWKLVEFEDVSYAPNLFQQASDVTIRLLGIIFLVGGLAFVVAGLGVLRRASWWAPVTCAAAFVSLAATVFWYQDAIIGLVIDVFVLAVLAVYAIQRGWLASHPRTPPKVA